MAKLRHYEMDKEGPGFVWWIHPGGVHNEAGTFRTCELCGSMAPLRKLYLGGRANGGCMHRFVCKACLHTSAGTRIDEGLEGAEVSEQMSQMVNHLKEEMGVFPPKFSSNCREG